MDKLNFIKMQMELLSVPYELLEWKSAITYPYFVGEFTETPSSTEDGGEESTAILTGFNRGTYMALEDIKERIEEHFDPTFGCRAKTDSGSIAVFFCGANMIPTNEAEMKKIEIYLLIKEWKKKGV